MPVPPLSYCARQVRQGDRDRFLAALFVPEPGRATLMAILALNLELAHVRDAVSEEMMGHIRLAWWQESVEALYGGLVRQGQPVLEALAPVIASGSLPQAVLMPLVEAYREHFPAPPPDIAPQLDGIAAACLETRALAGWRKAQGIIACHRRRFGPGGNGWLALRLLLAGLR